MNFIGALDLMRQRKKVARKDKQFKLTFDYIRIGIPDCGPLHNYGITFWKDGKENRIGELWLLDYLAKDWEEVKQK